MAKDKYEIGDFVLNGQFICKTTEIFPSSYVRESLDRRFHGGTIPNDTVPGLIWVGNQVSLSASDG